jgi:MinD-like ATPase involved in chromosome partitioning or flagellar assembly
MPRDVSPGQPWPGSFAADRPWSGAPRWVAVAGGRQGAGVSTLAALLAVVATARGLRVAVVETAAGGSPLPALLGAEAAGAGPVRSRTGPGYFPSAAAAMPQGGDLVLVDAGWRLERVLATCAGPVERIVVVTTGERAAVSASYGLLKAVEGRFPGLRFDVVVNREDPRRAPELFGHLQAAALGYLRRALTLAGTIPDDPCLRAGTRGGMTVKDAAVESELWSAAETILDRVLDGPVPPRGAAVDPRHLMET